MEPPVAPATDVNNTTPHSAPQATSEGVLSLYSKSAWITLLLVTVFGLVTDLWTKYLAFERVAQFPVVITREDVLVTNPISNLIPFHQPVTVVPYVLDFTLVLNPGAVFGMGAGQRVFFITFTIIALAVGLGIFSFWTRAKDWGSHVAVGLLISGGLGNLYDRVVYACVRDFLHPLPGVRLPFGWSWPWGGNEVWPYVSNVADLYLLIGIGILMVKSLRAPHTDQKPAQKLPVQDKAS